jgi:hypothetical protein
MTISEIFQLNKSQAELDFINIDPDLDTPLFIDPHFLSKRVDRWSIDATLTLRDFFQNVINLIRANDLNTARTLFDYLHEPNATCLGLSYDRPDGNGVGSSDTTRIFNNLIRSRAIQTGLIQDIQDNILFVDYFGKDKLSDMTTNIITKHLINYTISQCKLHDINLTSNVPSGHYWSRQLSTWHSEYAQRLVVNGKPLLLVPKGTVSFSKSYTPDRYYNHFVLNFLQAENLRINSSLVETHPTTGRRFVSKKILKERNPPTKDFLREFTNRHPEVLESFKNSTVGESLHNSEFANISVRQIAQNLINRLRNIPTGGNTATSFHSLTLGILELLFYPHLINPVKEREINNGRKRIDITFDNASKEGVFHRLSHNMNIPCSYIFIECKNYTSDVANPELDQLAGRFSVNSGKFGILACRTFDNKNLFIQRCKDSYVAGRGLIVPLDDSDIIAMLNNFNENDNTFIDNYLSGIIREIMLN